MCLVYIAVCARVQGLFYHIGRRLLTEEQDFGAWSDRTHALSRLYSAELRQTDIKQYQIRLQFVAFLMASNPSDACLMT